MQVNLGLPACYIGYQLLKRVTVNHRFIQEKDLTTGVFVREAYVTDGDCLHRDPKEGPALILRDPKTGRMIKEQYALDGKDHREDGPAMRTWDATTGVLLEECFALNNENHRLDGPAFVRRDAKTGTIVYQEYSIHGKCHRDPVDGPAVMQLSNENPNVVAFESYWSDNEYHRVNGPAYIERDPSTGEFQVLQYYFNGHFHRPASEGPASWCRDTDTGVVTDEQYSEMGRNHRPVAEGPAIILRDKVTGVVTTEEYWENGQQVSPPARRPRLQSASPKNGSEVAKPN